MIYVLLDLRKYNIYTNWYPLNKLLRKAINVIKDEETGEEKPEKPYQLILKKDIKRTIRKNYQLLGVYKIMKDLKTYGYHINYPNFLFEYDTVPNDVENILNHKLLMHVHTDEIKDMCKNDVEILRREHKLKRILKDATTCRNKRYKRFF